MSLPNPYGKVTGSIGSVFCLLLLLTYTPAHAQVYMTKDEALHLHFPNKQNVFRKNIFLTDDQVRQIQDKARAKVDSKILTYYEYREEGNIRGVAFFETQTVRTHPATFMIVLNSDGSVKAVEMLAFYEPEDYLPPKKWMDQFKNKTLQNDIYPKRGIPNVAGATLSAQAITESVRKYMIIHEFLINKGK
ncbi:FMN-binding protein [bacterium]|nr:MAG: FMN-binding protein [bacterium]